MSSVLPPQVEHILGQALASWPVCPQMVQVTGGVELLAVELLPEGVLELPEGVLELPEGVLELAGVPLHWLGSALHTGQF